MRNSLTLICVLCCWFGMARKAISAQLPATSGQTCSPAMLDVSALPGPPSFTYGGHLFVLEVQNISRAACSIQAPLVALAPASDTNNQPFYTAWRNGDPGQDTHEFEPRVLERGGWAHLLLMWTSRAGPELSCNLYSEVRIGFSYQWQQRTDPAVEIHHLWIRACGPFGVSGYRLGRYSSASPVPQKWLDWFGTGGLRGVAFPSPTASTEVATASPALTLSAKARRAMLGDRLFALKLNFPRLAGQGCAFSQLRKRESDGNTVILMQQCDDSAMDKSAAAPPVPWYHEPGVIGLYMAKGNLDFAPQRTGPLVYEITAPVGLGKGKKGGERYARARVDLVARDPALPGQAAVLDPLPACAPAQLRMDSLSPVTSTPLKTLRAYNATNISPQACSLAGVPRTRGLDDKGNYQPFLPPACPNCENELFMPRPNGRIDLKQGETAHLLAGGARNERGAGRCITTPKFEFSLNRDAGLAGSGNTGPLPADEAQSLTLPFEGDDCVSIDISAWRQGPYDGDPLNLHLAKLAQASEPAPIPSDCNKPELLAHGRPHLIEGTHDPEYGLSMEQHEFVRDEPVPLYLWTYNSSDHPIELGSCIEPAYLKAGGFVLYDAYGHRVLNKGQIATDKQCKADPSGIYNPLECTVNAGPFQLPAHTCTNSRIDLAKDYELPPGEYTLSTRDPGDTVSCPRRGDKPYKPNPATDIGFKVLQP
jgi:hypothetical protein